MAPLDVKQKIKTVLENMPEDWTRLTTHRLDIYNEELAKIDFLNHFEKNENLQTLPTAYDYIRLGHPLSCVLEWTIAKLKNIHANHVIAFSSKTMPLLAILRKNHFEGIETQIVFKTSPPKGFDAEVLKKIYAYDLKIVEKLDPSFKGHSVQLIDMDEAFKHSENEKVDSIIYLHQDFGSIAVLGHDSYISEVQHVRRRESIAMTPQNSLKLLNEFALGEKAQNPPVDRTKLEETIRKITNTESSVSIASSGLSIQYAIMMGLVDYANENHPHKKIHFIVPPNCYGGTNDQARRVAACLDQVEIVDLAVDSGKDMVTSLEAILDDAANLDAIPYIIAEIPTNPRVEVPDLEKLKMTLTKKRKTKEGKDAISSVFILDQTFCPDTKFLGEDDYLGSSESLSYVSGSKFPSGGLCTAGYVVSNKKASHYMNYIEKHLRLCDNGATSFQIETLTQMMPTMVERIKEAYENTRAFVNYIEKMLPDAKINFVPQKVAEAGFTPSVFSLDLPTFGKTSEEKEMNKRKLNEKLISFMIRKIPEESKHCVSYGQLSGSYWTIPATSTQGTTKEGDKDYIVRVSVAPRFNLEKHKEVFKRFYEENYRAS